MFLDLADDERFAWLRLSQAEKLDAESALRLLKVFGTPEDVLGADLKSLCAVAGDAAARELVALGRGSRDDICEEVLLRLASTSNADALPFTDPAYPSSLLEVGREAPLVLFVRGDARLLSRVVIGVSGTERPDGEAAAETESIAQGLAERGCTVLTRLAPGVESAALEGALRARTSAAAVWSATGFDRVHPASGLDLQRRILASGGVVASTTPPGQSVSRASIERRDRLFVFCAQAFLVPAAERTSLALEFARVAAEWGRDVFAVPGSLRSPFSGGPHRLIRDGAKLVETAADVLGDLKNPA